MSNADHLWHRQDHWLDRPERESFVVTPESERIRRARAETIRQEREFKKLDEKLTTEIFEEIRSKYQ